MDATEEPLVKFASRRHRRDGLFDAWCRHCGCHMKVTAKAIAQEFAGVGPICRACTGGVGGSYGGSPQSRHDNVYHGGRLHSAEWEG